MSAHQVLGLNGTSGCADCASTRGTVFGTFTFAAPLEEVSGPGFPPALPDWFVDTGILRRGRAPMSILVQLFPGKENLGSA